jgi:glycosyltransferase involved in cell wall biosynthesis
MKIQQVLLHDGIGGMETLAYGLKAQFTALGHGTRIHILDPSLNNGGLTGRITRLRLLQASIRNFEPDVVISHSAVPSVYARMVAGASLPVITVLHSSQDDFVNVQLRIAERALAKRTARVVTVSQHQVDSYLRRFPKMSNLTEVIPNGIRADISMRSSRRRKTIRMVAVSRFAPVKRLDLLLAAFAFLLQDTNIPPVSLDIIGSGTADEEKKVRAQILADSHLAQRVRLLGRRDDVHSLLKEYDLFVHTSQWEAHSLAILEAAAAGLPAIVSSTVAGGVDRNVAKLVFLRDSLSSLVQNLRDAILHLPTLQDYATATAHSIRSSYSIEECARQYLTLFSRVTGRSA